MRITLNFKPNPERAGTCKVTADIYIQCDSRKSTNLRSMGKVLTKMAEVMDQIENKTIINLDHKSETPK